MDPAAFQTSGMYWYVKGAIDRFVATLALLALLPLWIPITIALLFTGEREVFYCQTRVGFQRQNFQIWKFATMLKNSLNLGSGSLTVRNDPRVTTIGKYLRRSKLNELPQLFNLFNGTMTLVGPRPQVMQDFEAFPPDIQAQIYKVKPGITGIGSIVFRDEEQLLSVPGRDPRTFYVEQIAPYKGALEIWYQQHLSFETDLKLLLLTIWVILKPETQAHFRVFPDLPKLPKALKISAKPD